MPSITRAPWWRHVAALLLAMTAGLSAAPAAAAPCQQNCLTQADNDRPITITVDGTERTFLVYVPPQYSNDQSVPLLLDLHGFRKTAEDQRQVSGEREQARIRGFIAVWPQGLNNSWNAYNCCGASKNRKVDDVGFLRQVVETVKERANIGTDKVIITGLSNGASMAQRMACQATGLFKAVGAVSFPLANPDCKPSRPIETINIASINDPTVPYEGGRVRADPLGFRQVPSAQTGLDYWRDAQHCLNNPVTRQLSPEGTSIESYAACDGGVKVRLVTLPSDQHIPYQTSTINGVSIASYMWQTVFGPALNN